LFDNAKDLFVDAKQAVRTPAGCYPSLIFGSATRASEARLGFGNYQI
jgi:hypothetical protein